MSRVFVNVGLSLDGYMAPDGMTMGKPEYKNWGAKWGAMMAWIINQQYFRDNLKLGPGGETGPVNDLLRSTTERIGANIMGKRMFDQGEVAWPEEAPFHTPVFVLTRMSSANPGCGPVGRRFTSSMTGRSVPSNWPGRRRAVVMFGSRVERTRSSST
jgi:hypothetical protein